MEGTEEAFPNEDPGAPEGTPLEEEMSSTKPEIGSVRIRAVETRTSPGEQNVTSVRPPKSEASSRYPFHLQLVIMAEAALVICGEEEEVLWWSWRNVQRWQRWRQRWLLR
ncbi:hypothetical protein ACRRTK_014787 [Alexandromys fortis]